MHQVVYQVILEPDNSRFCSNTLVLILSNQLFHSSFNSLVHNVIYILVIATNSPMTCLFGWPCVSILVLGHVDDKVCKQ